MIEIKPTLREVTAAEYIQQETEWLKEHLRPFYAQLEKERPKASFKCAACKKSSKVTELSVDRYFFSTRDCDYPGETYHNQDYDKFNCPNCKQEYKVKEVDGAIRYKSLMKKGRDMEYDGSHLSGWVERK